MGQIHLIKLKTPHYTFAFHPLLFGFGCEPQVKLVGSADCDPSGQYITSSEVPEGWSVSISEAIESIPPYSYGTISHQGSEYDVEIIIDFFTNDEDLYYHYLGSICSSKVTLGGGIIIDSDTLYTDGGFFIEGYAGIADLNDEDEGLSYNFYTEGESSQRFGGDFRDSTTPIDLRVSSQATSGSNDIGGWKTRLSWSGEEDNIDIYTWFDNHK